MNLLVSRGQALKNGIVKFKSNLGSTNSEVFANFIFEFLEEIPDNKYLVMDNVSFYKPNIVKEIIADTNHKFMYLPPYLPFLNLIKGCFSKVKNSVARNYLEDQETIFKKIDEAFDLVTDKDCKNWIEHTTTYFQYCLDKVPINV
ncbi:24478_t:CDS:2 [Dentiscutata erythropus]|uniref:24478_t:CDS:1 n=1 Tax=Dentiscutata erythropus TaxID=1348616 RepID=A0A9N9H0G3_9GLOM|nr:24478_t:CDS:2 [Dentiscutata erythropus]